MMKLYFYKSILLRSVLAGLMGVSFSLAQEGNLLSPQNSDMAGGSSREGGGKLSRGLEVRDFYESLKTLSFEQRRDAIRQWQAQRMREDFNESGRENARKRIKEKERNPVEVTQYRQRFYQSLPEEQRKIFQERDQVLQKIREVQKLLLSSGKENEENVKTELRTLRVLREQFRQTGEKSRAFVEAENEGWQERKGDREGTDARRKELKEKWLNGLPPEEKQKMQELVMRREEWKKVRALPVGSVERKSALKKLREIKASDESATKRRHP